MVQKRVTDRAMMDTMMRGATPMRPGTMVLVHGGKMYVVPRQEDVEREDAVGGGDAGDAVNHCRQAAHAALASGSVPGV